MENRIFFGKVTTDNGGVHQLNKGFLIGKKTWFGELKENDIAIITEDGNIRNFRKVKSIEKLENNELKYYFEKILKNDFNPLKRKNDILYTKYFKFDKSSANLAYRQNPKNFNKLNLNEEYLDKKIEEFEFNKDSYKNIYFLTNEDVLKNKNININSRDVLFIVSNEKEGYKIKDVYNYNDKKIKEKINLKDINITLNIEKYGLENAYKKAIENNETNKMNLLKNIIDSINKEGYYCHPHDKELNILYDILIVNENTNKKNKKNKDRNIDIDTVKNTYNINNDNNKIKNLDEKLQKTDEECSYNQIFYGVPGCGKSYKIQQILVKNNINGNQTEKILFHPDYSYTDFIGQLEPKLIENKKENKNDVTYDFNPGPFSIILKKALADENKKYVLVIDEINRGNASAIFGDIFQLLDRNKNGESEFSIKNEVISKYLLDKRDGIGQIDEKKVKDIKIPSNLYIFATMNTSDQNVFTLDTAFKRRWNFEKISNIFNDKEDEQYKRIIPEFKNDEGEEITWGVFQEAINNIINKELINYGINGEDKQLGKYFVKDEELKNKKKFAYKVLMYLWDDVVKVNRNILFDTENYSTLDEVIEGFLDKNVGIKIFKENFKSLMSHKKDEETKEQK